MSGRDAINLHREDSIREFLLSGYQIALVRGRLQLAELGSPLNEPYKLEMDLDAFVCSVLAITHPEMKMFRFESFTPGRFGGGRYQGVCLQFRELTTGLNGYAIYNARLTRDRNTKFGKKGDLLPAGQFHVAKGAKLRELWLSTDIQEPKLSAYHCRMGLLKPLYFIAKRSDGEKLDKSTLTAASIHVGEIEDRVLWTDMKWLFPRHRTDKQCPSLVDKDTDRNQYRQGGSHQIAAGSNNRGEKVIRVKASSEKGNSDDEWLADYDRRDAELNSPSS